jgi:hypothetical protein
MRHRNKEAITDPSDRSVEAKHATLGSLRDQPIGPELGGHSHWHAASAWDGLGSTAKRSFRCSNSSLDLNGKQLNV